MGGYELIFPCADKDQNKNYEVMLKKSNDIFDDFSMGKHKRKLMEEAQIKKLAKGLPSKKSTSTNVTTHNNQKIPQTTFS